MDVLSQILQIDPKFSDAAIFLGNLAFDAGWWERAEQAIKAAEAKNAGNRLWFQKSGVRGRRTAATRKARGPLFETLRISSSRGRVRPS